MKLLSKTTLYLSLFVAIILAVWAVMTYVSMLDEIYDSIDDGLDNYKLLIIEKARRDPSVLSKSEFNESNYAIQELGAPAGVQIEDRYDDTLMFMRNEMDFEPVRILHTHFILDDRLYNLQIITSMVEEDDLIADLLKWLVFLYLSITLSMIIVNNLILRRLWKPFYDLITQLRSFDLTKPRLLTPQKTSIAEFKYLNEALSELLENNVARFNSQRQFIENASHELQTPLAASINKIELLLEDETLNESHARVLASLLQTLERLTRLNKSLILISNIENRQYTQTSEVSFNEVIGRQLDEFQAFSEYSALEVVLVEKAQFRATLNADLAIVLVSNLIMNAISHNFRGGQCIITIEEHQFSIANTSSSGPLPSQMIFTRFYREGGKSGSIGLGLSIVQGICEISGLNVTYSFSEGLHHMRVSRPIH